MTEQRVASSTAISCPSDSALTSETPDVPEEAPDYKDEFSRLMSFPYKWSHTVNKRPLAANGSFCNVDTQPQKVEASSLSSLHSSDCEFSPERAADLPRVNVALGDTSDYRYERNMRLLFFLATAPVDPADLEKWGFYSTGVADEARCNFCRLEITGWEPNDSGRSEHMRWNPHCPFMQNRAVGNIRLGDENLAGAVEVDGALLRHRHNVTKAATSNAEQYGVILTAPPRHPEYFMEQRPEQLAEAGFFFTGKSDRLICHQCGGGLKDWGPTDLPWVEHAVWFPRCAYLLMKKGREFVLQVQALRNEHKRNELSRDKNDSRGMGHLGAVGNQDALKNLPARNDSTRNGVVIDSNEEYYALVCHNVTEATTSNAELRQMLPRHPEYTSLASRLETYSTWPLSMNQTREHLAESGFYYTGSGDRVICYQCGGGLNDWGPNDSAWVKHALWFPRCSYLLMKKDKKYVASVQLIKSDLTIYEFARNSSLCHAERFQGDINNIQNDYPEMHEAIPIVNPAAQENLQSQTVSTRIGGVNEGSADEVTEDAASAMRMCKVCLKKELGIVFLPCGHMAACPDCAPQLANCPICRGGTKAYVRAYLP